tara:strand:- start:470 stop:844 length:375 start_codon:yes stop_codon:yes gene_type:complete
MKILEKGDYEMTDGSPVQRGFSCEDKVETDHMSEEEYESICKYVPGGECSMFPQEVVQYLLEINSELEMVDNDKEKTSVKSPDTIAWWQEPGDTPVGWEQQTLDPILLALNSKAICSRLNHRSR